MNEIKNTLDAMRTALEVSGAGAWVLEIFFVVLVVVAVNFVQRRVLRQISKRLENTRNPWDDALIVSAQAPLSLLIWIIGLTLIIEIVQDQAAQKVTLFDFYEPIREVGVIFCLSWFLVRLIHNVKTRYAMFKQMEDEEVDQTTLDVIGNLLRIAVIITGALVMLQTLGFSVSGVLAFGGVGGIAVGFAAKDLLANFFGALMVYLDRPFQVGDWVRSPDQNIEGTVESIGWRTTCIRTFDKRPLYVPNSIFNNISVENPSRMTNRRIKETISIRYSDAEQMSAIVEDVKAMLRAHPEIDQDQTMIVNFDSFAASSLDFFIYTFTKTTNWIKFHEIKHDVLLKVMKVVEGHGAEFAFPTRTLHVADAVLVEQTAP